MREKSAKIDFLEVGVRLGFPAHEFNKLPSPVMPQLALCTNEAAGAVPVYSDGTNWRRVSDNVIATEAP